MEIALYLAGGIALLWLGGDAFVYGSVAVAHRFRLSELMIGLTLVAFGTSLPELVTSVSAALAGSPGLAVGNVVGSNSANILLILGIAALIRPVICQPGAFSRDAIALALVTLLGAALILLGRIGLASGLLLLACLAVYIGVVYRHEKVRAGPAEEVLLAEAEIVESVPVSLPRAVAMTIGGLAAVIGGAWLVVAGATDLALIWGVSQTFIGLTIVAIGTSLPELMISVIAAFRGRSDVALGNVIGSNIFNILAILGVTATITPIEVPAELGMFDVSVMVAATALLIIVAAARGRIPRWEGLAFLAAYIAYTIARAAIAL